MISYVISSRICHKYRYFFRIIEPFREWDPYESLRSRNNYARI